MSGDSLEYTPKVVKSFQIAKVFEPSEDLINSIDFSDDGEFLALGGNDNNIRLYSLLDESGPKCTKVIPSKKYGCSHVTFTHSNKCIVHASRLLNDDLRYLSLHDSKYIRYFKGHKKSVTKLDMSPTDDTFLSASDDKTVRFWDLRAQSCQGTINIPGRPIACFDSTGLVFAVGESNMRIQLFSAKSYSKGPFTTFNVPKACAASEWTDIQPSADGKFFALSTRGGETYFIDAYEGKVVSAVGDKDIATGHDMSCSYSPCSSFLACGGKGGMVDIWNTRTYEKDVSTFSNVESDDISCLKFNPKYAMFATASNILALWLPSAP
eukprot:m.240842 g.240842  ORF g.240842 m.240842 type:complete len:323 (+) comp16178_c0_seq1:168-1136(+)